jgi:hypothetical protein
MIIRRSLTTALHKFKRIHESQISHQVKLDPELIIKLRRHSLRQKSDAELITLSKDLINHITQVQSTRTSPHQGLAQFTNELRDLTAAE